MMAKDNYPQWLRLNGAQETVPGTYVQSATIAPIRISGNQVMEILGIEMEVVGGSFAGISDDADTIFKAHVATHPSDAVEALDASGVLDVWHLHKTMQIVGNTGTGAAGAGMSENRIVWHDFASSGKGFLTAAETFYVGVRGAAVASDVLGARVRMLYRIVTVSPAELIGLLAELVG